jgi:ADP-ribose pyrophosphatase YjhB (NUDIX family)
MRDQNTEYTAPEVLTDGVERGWADPETDPTRIDWPARQAAAAIPFQVVDGRPVNPCEQTKVKHGRNELGHWGEAVATDALVNATDEYGQRWILMVERDDGHGYALPGGHVDPDDATPLDAAIRELAEEGNVKLPRDRYAWTVDPPRYVSDPRVSDESWMVTVLCRVDLGRMAYRDFPQPTAGDDAASAAWMSASTFDLLIDYLQKMHGGFVFRAHRQMLADALDQPQAR